MRHIGSSQNADNQRINTSLARAAIIAAMLLAEACASVEPRSASSPSDTTPATSSATAAVAPVTPAPATAEPTPIRIESVIGSDDITLVVTTPVTRGQPARATVTTNPHAFCSISITYASGPSTTDGLAPKDADGGGFVSWSWTVEQSAPEGSWPVEVSCGTVSGLRAVARQTIVVR